MKRLSENIFYLPGDPATDRPALGYVRGGRDSLMVDAGNSPRHAEQYLSAVQSAGLRAPRYVAVTHSHWDHSFGLCGVPAVSLACRATSLRLAPFCVPWNSGTLERYLDAEGLREFSAPHMLLEYPDAEQIKVQNADISFEGELTLELGGCTCLLRQIPSPHCGDCILVHVPSEGVLFLGDAGCEELVHGEWIDRPDRLEALLREVERLDFSVCLTGHDPAPLSREALLNWFSGRLAET